MESWVVGKYIMFSPNGLDGAVFQGRVIAQESADWYIIEMIHPTNKEDRGKFKLINIETMAGGVFLLLESELEATYRETIDTIRELKAEDARQSRLNRRPSMERVQ